jgi:hypothetical protein
MAAVRRSDHKSTASTAFMPASYTLGVQVQIFRDCRDVDYGRGRLRGYAFGFCVRFLSCPTAGRDGLRRKHPMAQYAATVPFDFDLPAPICVCALLVACALTKGGHPYWAIGAPIFLYTLNLAAQRVMICVYSHVLVMQSAEERLCHDASSGGTFLAPSGWTIP